MHCSERTFKTYYVCMYVYIYIIKSYISPSSLISSFVIVAYYSIRWNPTSITQLLIKYMAINIDKNEPKQC